MDGSPANDKPSPSSAKTGLGKWAAAGLAMLIPVYLAVFSLIGFPIRVMLERDLQLNGHRTTGHIVEYKLTHGKRNLPIHNYLVRYRADSKTRLAWVHLSGPNWAPGDEVDIVYAPAFTRFARPASTNPDPWDQNLVVRSLAQLFIGVVCSVMAVGFYRRIIGRHRKRPGGNEAHQETTGDDDVPRHRPDG